MQVGTFRSSVTQAAYRPGLKSARRVGFAVSAVALAVLAGCASRQTQAPVTDMSGGGATSSVPATGTYIVKPGDTLYKIAQAHNIEVGTLVRLNNITDPGQLRVGQSLRLSGAAGPVSAPVTTAPVAPVPATEPAAEPTTAARAKDASIISWGWPATGKIIQSFNANTKGIDIAGSVGDPVVAAASGKVMYAGNGVRGLGNLILLGHDSGFITAYAHNQKLLVKTGQSVQKGAKIAAIGQTDTTSPRLHFEIRRSGTPVNPLSYLPAR
ncbi:peptidoglycan DD-metalloendopeptidase family protein [Eoetvoesiella caeni]|uniref:Lipoprotein NlpD n=1 Tax=Eoetvoesiella caeni TaxID=645616 RepID=A0A366HMB9_9BURK|nr:peptidoglycan DD-metalloendopeptidase family protein [Eoetvoesiella caeni]RBP43095.1 lipoprotein NlpD [Eoetvoesiella caeni]